ncbi:cytochrome o ubiquinol oxidase subunit I [Burkholderia stabilis]|uniref:Ubiquinol oxidase subunit 1,cytochrome o ubiquinol oxidase subunit I,cytochrome o ubiquinol oxidase, subunit I,Cytochrome C and Quinol oxidase polypeptide I n=1 Tax=Burkholderia stabilis TaxID=95485 RepID=A0AAJ5N745_9BURK|nr:cytochrome o ubiquinol oxidase subunit I [Burkholderia stabilis]AOR66349.1 cytochrome o ubiquinol oxidase subunit I [Burkholderia stabilis]VBB10023.1 Ubiquinol oxidase subunit 1,cytochrome o ubiquinol oxidase subunit I,cytochrome o ubiquinol oxidase, subunit I,Cytochrome C and Quinol oxidase polypeptide I [Burkholderia stabilis]HDR9490453.1 cytochrome o ubiquinol oxidase subunit I [Burkholderia stabilis]HDR9524649.1 cytochrome o ubiquinol oxidase subunit I [Burkholderia stabilis]HDR9534849.
MFGKLTLSAIPFDQPIIMVAGAFMGLAVLGILAALTITGRWKWLWTEWLTTVDHKKLGVMYIIVALIMLLRGFADAIMMRMQLALAYNAPGYLPPHHYDQIFTAHGVIMIFFMAMVFMVGLMNLIVPLQIGARDVAFPFINSLSFWMTAVSAILINISLVIGEFAQTGWLAYPPLSELQYSPGVGVDYYLWALQISGVGTLLTGVNFFVTIIKMRAPGMTLMKMPVFTWTALCTNVLIMASFPILTATLALLGLDRYLGMHFFTNEAGGNAMLYLNLIWAWGHPEVYILILPAFGIFSEVIATFAKKPLFGYKTMVYATCAIMVLSFLVWLHHFFTMGSGANVNAFFGIMTMIIAIPTGVKVFNWLFTMYRGRIEFTTPVLWTIGFMVTFTLGGMTGVMMAIPGADFVLHNSLFLIAHFHNVIIGGVLFGYLAGFNYWFPKAFGFKLNEKLGKAAFWFWQVGFYVAFVPLYVLGFMGMTRRLNHYDNPAWHPWLLVAAFGAVLIAIGIACQLLQLVVSIRNRNLPEYRDTTGDPWGGRTLEWATTSPPADYNFAVIPQVRTLDAYADMKARGEGRPNPASIRDIHMPSNTCAGLVIAIFSLVLGFALVWHIWWMAIGGLVGIVATLVIYSSRDNDGYYIPASTVRKTEDKQPTKRVAAHVDDVELEAN